MNSMPLAPAFNLHRGELTPYLDEAPSSKSASLPESTIPVGEYAPAFVLPRWDVGSFGFAEFLGKPSVLYFYSGSGGDWPRQSAILADLSPNLDRLGISLVGIVAAEHSAVSLHCKATSTTFPVLIDWEPRALVSRLYGFNRAKAAPVLPATFLIDARGVIRWISGEDHDCSANATEILSAVRSHLLRPFPVGPVD